jgi:hypothetical protein
MKWKLVAGKEKSSYLDGNLSILEQKMCERMDSNGGKNKKEK